ncbi:MFS transporter [Naumannella huperziae]
MATSLTEPVPAPEIAPDGSGVLRKNWLVLTAMMLALVTVMMDNSILNVALPTIARDLGASAGDLQWIVSAYSVTFGGLLLTTGNLSDRIGRRKVMLAGLALMAVASLAILVAGGTVPGVIAVRALVGVGAALVMPSTLSLLFATFTGPARGSVMGVFSIAAMAGFTIGPVLGGLLLSQLHWNWLFLLNIPVALIAIPVLLRAVPESTDGTAEPADLIGAVTSVFTMGGLIYALGSGPENGWLSVPTLAAAAIALLAGIAFIARQLRAAHPMLDVSLLTRRAFALPALVEAMVFFMMMATMFITTQLLQLVFGYSAVIAGLMTLPSVVLMLATNGLITRLTTALGDRRATALGLALGAVGFGTAALGVSQVALLIGGIALSGVGNRMAMTSAALRVIDALPPERAGMGSALNDTFQEVGSALGIGVLGAVLSQLYRLGLPPGVTASLAEAVSSGSPALAQVAQLAFSHAAQLTIGAGVGALLVTAVVCLFAFLRQAAMPAK